MEIYTEETIDEVRLKCEDNLPFGYNVHIGTLIKETQNSFRQTKVWRSSN